VSVFHEAIELTLRAPYLRGARVALRFLPADGGLCTQEVNAYSDPSGTDAIPWQPAAKAATAMAAYIAAGRVGMTDPPLYLDAALRANGAYAAFGGIPAAAFGRRAVVVVGNRDFDARCDPSIGTTPLLAFESQDASGVRTTAVLLSAPPTADQNGRDVWLDGLSMARSGGGSFYDGAHGDESVRVAVLGLAVDAASCLYDLPTSIDTSGDLSAVKISYFDLASSTRTDIDYDPTCTSTGGDKGWNVDGRRVRLCGSACDGVHGSLGTTGTYALDHHIVPPDIPVRWTAPCR
jgi:hypothetical protein